MKTALITGGTGFIGSRLALRCLEEGERVRVLALKNTAAERENTLHLEKKGVEVVEGSVTDREAARRACSGADVVYHLAAAQHEANKPDSYYHEVNVEGTRNMLDGAVEAGVKRFVHGSTIGVYGAGRNGPVKDDSALEPDNIYGVTKLAGERLVRTYFEKMPAAILRFSETYGPGDRRLLKLYKGIAQDRFVKIGRGRNWHHPVYIDDLVECLRLSAVHPKSVGQTFVIAGPQALTTDEMIAAISKSLGKNPPALRVPLWPLMGTAFILEALLRPVGIQPPLHRRRMQFFVKSFRFDDQAAREAIGYQPQVGFEEGAKRTLAWYRSTNLLQGRASNLERQHCISVTTMSTTTTEQRADATAEVKLSSKMERFDSFWEGPADIERGYKSVGQFYKVNYLKHLPGDREARILVISCGPGYFVNVLNQHGYRNVTGIDSHPEKVEHAIRRGLNCRAAKAFEELGSTRQPYDVIFCEQELNHLTKDEMVAFLNLVWDKLTPGGRLICHGLNGANPVVGAENLALNFDHFNTFTKSSFEQVLEHCGFRDLKIFGLNLYVFYKNPFNYVAWGVSSTLSLIFRALFILYGKSNKIFTKKIAAVALKPV